jgi:F0F1-type ATP synthase membrane subunit b/b'
MSPGPIHALIPQVAALPDTIVARIVPTRDLLDWSTGILELVVLLLGAAVLTALILLLLAARQGVRRVSAAAERLADDTRPMLQEASATVAEARAMVATVREDVSKVSGAAGAVGDQLREATEATAQRIREVGAVLDVVQEELEETALAGAQALRGLRLGGLALLNRRRKRRRSAPSTSRDAPDVRPRDADDQADRDG